MILSIDVGIRNLAMCLLDEERENLVTEWDVSGVPPEHRDGLYVSMRDHLDARPWVLTAKTILIEKQPERNKKMISVMHFLHSYFIIKCPKSYMMLDTKYLMSLVPVGLNTTNVRKSQSRDAKPSSEMDPLTHIGWKHFKNLKRKMISQIR